MHTPQPVRPHFPQGYVVIVDGYVCEMIKPSLGLPEQLAQRHKDKCTTFGDAPAVDT